MDGLVRVALLFKQLRTEIWMSLGAVLVLAVALLVCGLRLDALRSGACPVSSDSSTCADGLRQFAALSSALPVGQTLAAGATAIAALVLGVAVVGRELERSTVWLPWTLARSRALWLAERWIAVALLLAASSLLVGATSTYAQGAAREGADLAASFDRVDLRGPVVALRSVAVFGIAVTAGIVIGRSLPALLVAAGVAVLALVLVESATNAWIDRYGIPLQPNEVATARVIDTVWRDATTGRFLTRDEYLRAQPPPGAASDWLVSNFEPVPFGVPGALAGEYGRTEITLLLVIAGGSALAAAPLLERCRP